MFPQFPNIYEQQRRNRRNTILVIVIFILFFAFLGYGFDLFYFGVDPLGFFGKPFFMIPFGTILALFLGGGMAWWGLTSGAEAVLRSSGAVPVTGNENEYRTLINVVDEMTIASGLPRPRLHVIPDPDPNAFATGRDPWHSHVAVTQGLIEKLNREELQGVIAHEMAHIKNYDIRMMTVVAALMGSILLLADMSARMMRFGGLGRKGGGRSSRSGGQAQGAIMLVVFVLWLLAIILSPIIVRLLAMAVSRHREYLADASGAELTRNPLALASALEKIEGASEPTKSIKKSAAHLCIVDPLGRKVNFKEGKLADLFATHPPISKRITLLKAMAYQYERVKANV